MAYVSSLVVLFAVILSFSQTIELKRDVSCEVVSASALRIFTPGGRVSGVLVRPGQVVKRGAPLVTFERGSPETAGPSATANVVAPVDGTVLFVNARNGQPMERGDVAVTMEASSVTPLRVALRIPSEQRGFVQEKQSVRIKLDAFPFMRFGTHEAEIESISLETIGEAGALGTLKDITVFKDGAGDYLAWATLGRSSFRHGGQELRILPGMRGKAAIVVERLTLAEWVFAPLFRTARG